MLGSVILVSFALGVMGILLPPPSGNYNVSHSTAQLLDVRRADPWRTDSITSRRLMISQFEPVSPRSCSKKRKISYMPPKTSAAEDEILEPYGWPKDVLGRMEMEFCSSSASHSYSKKDINGRDTPTVLFSPGLNTSRLFYSALAADVASHGYTVVTIDHPFETDIVEFPDGSVAYGGNTNTSDLGSINFALDVRMRDVSFVLNTLGIDYEVGTPKAVMFGHSFGGAATAAAMLNDTRVRGGVNLDGLLFGPVINAGLGRPGINQSFVLWGAEGHDTSSDEDWSKFWRVLDAGGAWKRQLSLKGGSHGSFWDLPLVADVAAIRGRLSQETQLALTGTLKGQRIISVLSLFLDSFFGFVLGKREDEGLMVGPNSDFPEVVFIGA